MDLILFLIVLLVLFSVAGGLFIHPLFLLLLVLAVALLAFGRRVP